MSKHIRKKKLEGLDKLWASIRAKKVFTISEIQNCQTFERNAIKSFLNRLEKGGFLKSEEVTHSDKRKSFRKYTLLKDNGIHRPVLDAKGEKIPPSRSQKIWDTIKVLKRFSYKDVTLACEIGMVAVQPYLTGLRKTGYIKCRPGKESGTPNICVFIADRDTGPQAPVRKGNKVYDPNTMKTHQFDEGISNE